MSLSNSDWILILNGVAVFLAPLAAIQIGGILQRRSDDKKLKLNILGTLMGLRHDLLSSEVIRALNLIDAVFVDDATVRESYTRYHTVMTDPAFNNMTGYSIRDERRRDLLLAMVKSLGLQNKISSADLLRNYMPTVAVETTAVGILERLYKRAYYETELKRLGVLVPPWPIPEPSTVPAPAPITSAQPSTTSGNGAAPPSELR